MKLKEWLDTQKMTITRFSEIIDRSPSMLWKIFWHGTNNLRLALEIEKVTYGSVTCEELLEPELENSGIRGRKSHDQAKNTPNTPKKATKQKSPYKRLTKTIR